MIYIYIYIFLIVLQGAYFLIIFQVTLDVKWLRFIDQYSLDSSVSFSVVKPVFEIDFSGSYVNFLYIFELVRRDLSFKCHLENNKEMRTFQHN